MTINTSAALKINLMPHIIANTHSRHRIVGEPRLVAGWPKLWVRNSRMPGAARPALAYRLSGRGRPRKYGARQATPQQCLHTLPAWTTVRLPVRGRVRTRQVAIRGPLLVQPAAAVPLVLLVVRGTKHHAPLFLLVNARKQAGRWVLPYPLRELLAWAWQRWEVEVMHRELKSGFGLGQQQAFSAQGAATVVPWVLWVYALLILTGYLCWGLGPGTTPDLGRWWQARRWSIGRLHQGLRAELWQAGEFQPVWQRSPDPWQEITGWIASQTTAALGARRL